MTQAVFVVIMIVVKPFVVMVVRHEGTLPVPAAFGQGNGILLH